MAERLVFVREAGTVDYDIFYATDNVTLEEFHFLIQDTIGIYEPLVKINCEGVAVRNQNGIKFLLAKPEPKLEVTFSGRGCSCSLRFSDSPRELATSSSPT